MHGVFCNGIRDLLRLGRVWGFDLGGGNGLLSIVFPCSLRLNLNSTVVSTFPVRYERGKFHVLSAGLGYAASSNATK